MSIAFLDLGSGASGDMLLAACCDLFGIDWQSPTPWHETSEIASAWHRQVSPLLHLVPEGRMELKRVVRGGMAACKIDFYAGAVHADDLAGSGHDHEYHHHHHEHHHGHHHDHSHDHSHEHDEGHHHHHRHDDHHHHHDHEHRSYTEIVGLIDAEQQAGRLPEKAASLAKSIFTILGRAEAKVHGTDLDHVHFHEVGAFDSIMDIVGFAAAYTLLDIKQLTACAPTLGSGHVAAAHGMLTVPVPAVVEIMREYSIPSSGLELPGECLTPTGAAILAAVVERWQPQAPAMTKLAGQGVGAGTREVAVKPNVVRLILGQS